MVCRPLLRHTHVGGKGAMRHPLGRVARIGLLQHPIDLFERQTLGFGNEQVCVEEADGAEAAPDEEDFGTEVAFVGADHVGCDDCDDL